MAPHRGATALCALVALSSLSLSLAGVTQVITPYGAVVMSTYPNGVTRNPAGEPAGTVATAVTNGVATSYVLSSQATPAQLAAVSSNQVRARRG